MKPEDPYQLTIGTFQEQWSTCLVDESQFSLFYYNIIIVINVIIIIIIRLSLYCYVMSAFASSMGVNVCQ